MTTHQGSCHCGAVAFEIESDLNPVVRCNCSLCKRKGAVIHRLPQAQFTLLRGEDALSLYQFNTMAAKHYFCKHCGIYTHHQPRTKPDFFGVNVGCLDGVDALSLEYEMFDGASLS